MSEALYSPLTLSLDHKSLSVDLHKLHAHILLICDLEAYTIEDLNILFTTHEQVRRLNVEYLQHDYNTDVLSFSYSSTPDLRRLNGEIYVSLDMADERHSEFNATFEEEAYRYAIHGLLHLMGYNDKTPAEQKIMKERESHYLAMLTGS